MPNIIDKSSEQVRESDIKDLSYDYPEDLDLRPGSTLHKRLVSRIMQRAQQSQSKMQERYPYWREIDRTLTTYVDLKESELKVKDDDERKPVSVVVPISYATLETLLTYFVSAFLQDPVFRYEGTEPDDIIKGALLEHVVAKQVKDSKMGLELHTAWRDAFTYGFGVVVTTWETKYAFRTIKTPQNAFSNFLRKVIRVGTRTERQRVIRYEGNELMALDPYRCYPDPNIPIHRVQDSEFFGFLEETNYSSLLNEEQDNERFNVRYLKSNADNRSKILRKEESGRSDRFGFSEEGDNLVGRPVDVLWMFVNLIPEDWELGDEEYPEWWLFGVAGDKTIVHAGRLGLDHGMLPVFIFAPEFDGHSITPISKLEAVYPMQETLDWFISSHIANVRKSLNDMFVVDPFMVNINDLKDPEPGKLIRLRRAVWGRGVKDAVMQLQVNDVTRTHVQDAGFFIDIIQRTSAATDILQGIMRSGGERRSATESRDAKVSALSRLERAATVTSMMGMLDLAYVLASQTIQFMSKTTWVNIVGRYEQVLQTEYEDRAKVEPGEINIPFDVIPHDGTSPGGENLDAMGQAFQVIASNEVVAQQFDIVRIFLALSRAAGFKNVQEFMKKGDIQARTATPEQIQAGVQNGSLAPLGDLTGG